MKETIDADNVNSEVEVVELQIDTTEEQEPMVNEETENKEETEKTVEADTSFVTIDIDSNQTGCDSDIRKELDENTLQIKNLQNSIQELKNLIENKVLIDSIRDNTISKLHSELMDYKNDLLLMAMKPLINGIIELTDDITNVCEYLPEIDRSREYLLGFKQHVLDVLSVTDFESYESTNEVFNSTDHFVIGFEKTPKPEMNGIILKSKKLGFRKKNQNYRKESVVIYKYDASLVTPASEKEVINPTEEPNAELKEQNNNINE